MAYIFRLHGPTAAVADRQRFEKTVNSLRINEEQDLGERAMGVEPTYPAWKAGVLAVVLRPHTHRDKHGA